MGDQPGDAGPARYPPALTMGGAGEPVGTSAGGRSVSLAFNGKLHYHRADVQKDADMTTLTVTTRGQVTFRKDVLQHLGIKPGEKIELDKLPDGRVTLRAARPSGSIDGFLGLLAGKSSKVATLDEINQAASDGWAGKA